MTKTTRFALSCVAMLLFSLFSGCSNVKGQNIAEPIETTAIETTEQTIPGVALNILDESGFFEDEATEFVEESIEAENDRVEEITDKEAQEDPTEAIKETIGEKVEEITPEKENTVEAEQDKEEIPQSETKTEFEIYNAMSGADQKKFMDSFESIEAFFEWYNNAKEEYDGQITKLDAENPVVDMSVFAE